MKKSTFFRTLSYIWLAGAMMNLFSFMSSTDILKNWTHGLICLLATGMFYLNSYRMEQELQRESEKEGK